MQGEHRHAHPDDVFHRARDRVVDVEELHVEEDLAAIGCEIPRQFEAAGKDQLVTDLEEAGFGPELADHRLRLGRGRHVEPDDQPVAPCP